MSGGDSREFCIAAGIIAALLLDKLNQKYTV